MKHIFFAILLFAACLPFAARAQDENVIGTIIEVEGSASLNGTTAAADMPVHMNDVIETSNDSKMDILFIDDTELTLGGNARLTVDEYVFDQDAATGNKGRFSVMRGAFLFVSGLITKNGNPDVKINTGYGSIGLRGTIVWGGRLDDEYGVLVQDGEVTFENDRARTIIRKGEGVNIHDRGSMPTTSSVWGEEKIGRAVKTIALKRAQFVRQRVAERTQQNVQLRQQRRGQRQDLRQERRENIQEKLQERIQPLPQKQQQRPLQDNRPSMPDSDGSAPSREMRERGFLRSKPGGRR